MKTLMIGMDGASLETFKRGWTPFISSLIESGDSLPLVEDLISRGWLEVATGCHGVETGALYDRASLNGTHDWSLKFSIDDIPGLGKDIKPLWQVLSERDYRVGIMNLPTINPAPEVNGFFVSGGGGGKAVQQKISEDLCFPKNIMKTLQDLDYIVDERIGSLIVEKKLLNPNSLFDRLEYKNSIRTESFIKLSKTYDIDFGFVVYKSSSNLAEFLLLPEWERLRKGEPNIDTDFIEAVKKYYVHFDSQIRRLVEEFPDAEVILVSDHGMSVRKWLLNPNVFLQEAGFQAEEKSKKKAYDFVNFVKKMVPFWLRIALRKNSKIRKMYESAAPFSKSKSLAFCMPLGDWSHGIYVNDLERFGGPVKEDEVEELRVKIADSFNLHRVVKEHGLSATVKHGPKTKASQYYPDIIINLPDGYMTTNETKNFVEKFKAPKGPLGIDSITKGRLLCGKGHHPIAVCYNGAWSVRTSIENSNLTLVYSHILRTFK